MAWCVTDDYTEFSGKF